jgi:hypothetical protein
MGREGWKAVNGPLYQAKGLFAASQVLLKPEVAYLAPGGYPQGSGQVNLDFKRLCVHQVKKSQVFLRKLI